MSTDAAVAIVDEATLAIFDRALPEVYHYVLHRCRDNALAEDLTSDTFLGAVRAIRQGRAEDVSVAWLIGIARHKLVDHWRRSSREQRHLAAIYMQEVLVEPQEMIEIERGRAMIVLATISPMHRAALTLRYVDGLSVPDVAEVLGRSVHATETLLVRARAAFRSEYNQGSGRSDD